MLHISDLINFEYVMNKVRVSGLPFFSSSALSLAWDEEALSDTSMLVPHSASTEGLLVRHSKVLRLQVSVNGL